MQEDDSLCHVLFYYLHIKRILHKHEKCSMLPGKSPRSIPSCVQKHFLIKCKPFNSSPQNNIALALEVTYRERLHRAYKEVKNRLDYHISVQNMMRRKEQEHMIDWVEKHVVQSISAQQVHDLL